MRGSDLRFGILPSVKKGISYTHYPPNMTFKERCIYYNCVPISDLIVNEWWKVSNDLPTYSGTIDRPFKGIDITSDTIIPPESARLLAELVKPWIGERNVADVIELFKKAADEGKHVISFGI